MTIVFALQKKHSSAFEEDEVYNVGKSTVQASNAATNTHTHTRPTSCFKVSDVLSLSFGVFMSCRRVRVALPIGSPGVYMGRIVLVRPRSSSLHRQIATLNIAIAYCCYCWYSCCSTLLAGCQLTSCAAYACMTTPGGVSAEVTNFRISQNGPG